MRVRDGSAVFTDQSRLNCRTHGSALMSYKNVTITHISDFLSRYSSPGKRILTKSRKKWWPGRHKLVQTVLRGCGVFWGVQRPLRLRIEVGVRVEVDILRCDQITKVALTNQAGLFRF